MKRVIWGAVVILVGIATGSRPASGLIVATNAADVCAPTADPCNVTEEVQIQAGAVLDFGNRTLNVSSNGKLNFGSKSATLLCGDLVVDVGSGSTAIKVKATEFGEVIGGVATIRVQRGCSKDSSIACQLDATCAAFSAGTCTGGSSGVVNMNGKITGDGVIPGEMDLVAVGDITIQRPINFSGSTVDSDGGILEISSLRGSVTIAANIDLSGGIFSAGGDVLIRGGTDVRVDASIEVSGRGGDSDGGVVELEAAGDVIITDDILAKAGAGLGGEIIVDAGRDIVISGGTSNNRVQLLTTGSMDSFGSSGDGGTEDFTAGRDIVVGQFVKIEGNGSPPDGDGAFGMALAAGRDIAFSGQLGARSKGSDGGGGDVDLDAVGTITLTATSDIDVRGGSAGAGAVGIFSGGPLVLSGTLDATATNGGEGGFLWIDSDDETRIDGSINMSGTPAFSGNGVVSLTACEVVFAAGGIINNDGGSGLNTITGLGVLSPQSILFEAGSTLSAAGGGGLNSLVYLDPLKPPVINGTVSPAAVQTVSSFLRACSGCGDSILDPGETCDDGNSSSGDGCSQDCQLESCIAQSLDYPNQPLCNDSDGCTIDTCNPVTGACERVVDCDDGIACTLDSCVGVECSHTPDDSLCNDSSVCTDNICLASSGCSFENNLAPCDDGLFCNGSDSCIGGSCKVHAGENCAGECEVGCDEGSDSCLAAPLGQSCADEGNVCTDDQCDGGGSCAHLANTALCDDGVSCTTADVCGGGLCQGDPIDSLCVDGDLCTDGLCSGGSGCSFVFNNAPCDDGDVCTVSDTCASGVCVGGPACGDGLLQTGCGEQCDPPDGTTCDSSCILIVCGNGLVQPGEDCDDGNTIGGDCCDASCVAEPQGSLCLDSDVCNGTETCDGTGFCTSGSPLDCDDSDPCSQDSCDSISGCANNVGPATGCLNPGKTIFQVVDKTVDSKDVLKWKWLKGDSTSLSDFGNPRFSTHYALCVYDGSGAAPAPVAALEVPAGSTWASKGSKGFKYKDKLGGFDGVQLAQVLRGVGGKSKAQLKAKGVNVPLPQPFGPTQFFEQSPSVVVQLFNDNEVCWTSSYSLSDTKKNTVDKFKAKVR